MTFLYKSTIATAIVIFVAGGIFWFSQERMDTVPLSAEHASTTNSFPADPIQGKVYTDGVVHMISVAETGCGRQESWYDLATGDKRVEGVRNYDCRGMKDLIDGQTGTNLALYSDPSEYRAKWIGAFCGEYGLPTLESGDPFTEFNNKLKMTYSGPGGTFHQYTLTGTTVVEGKEAYVLSYAEGQGKEYYDTATFFPLATEYGDLMRERYTLTEVIDRDSLPETFFDQTIPPDFTLEPCR